MRNIKRFFWFYLFILTGLWLVADLMVWSSPANFFAWRAVLMQYSGVLGIGVMSVAMVLAVRPVVFEPYLGGLDKMYRLHKWLGISGLVISVAHWLLAQGTKWAVGWGWLQRPVRGPRPALLDAPIQQFFSSQRGLAESIGEWAFYAAVALIVIALVHAGVVVTVAAAGHPSAPKVSPPTVTMQVDMISPAPATPVAPARVEKFFTPQQPVKREMAPRAKRQITKAPAPTPKASEVIAAPAVADSPLENAPESAPPQPESAMTAAATTAAVPWTSSLKVHNSSR